MGTIKKIQEAEMCIYFSLIFLALSPPFVCTPIGSDEGPMTFRRMITQTFLSSTGFIAHVPTGYHPHLRQ